VDLFQVNGSILGSTGGQSGLVAGRNVDSIVVLGNVVGGESSTSGSIEVSKTLRSATIVGSLVGGSGEYSGELFAAGGMGSITVLGSLTGGAGDSSGNIETLGSAEDILVAGNVTGGVGAFSGKVRAGTLASLTIGGNLAGGEGLGSGTVSVDFNAGEILIGGSITGSSGIESGGISSNRLAKLVIAGDLRGGPAELSGSIQSGLLNSVTIGGDMLGGAGALSGSISSFEIQEITIGRNLISSSGDFSGAIITDTYLTSLAIRGDVTGNASNPVRIIAGGFAGSLLGSESIGTVQIGGSATYLNILAGYGTFSEAEQVEVIPVNDQVRIGRVTVQGDWTAGSIAAGVEDVEGNGFGNADDMASFSGSPAVISTIASIQIGGKVSGTTATGDHFGFTADWVKRVQIGGVNVPLTPGPGNDRLLAVPGVTTGDFTINEIA
jgi:hypothetical protein